MDFGHMVAVRCGGPTTIFDGLGQKPQHLAQAVLFEFAQPKMARNAAFLDSLETACSVWISPGGLVNRDSEAILSGWSGRLEDVEIGAS